MCLVGMILCKILSPRSWILRVQIGIRESENFLNGGSVTMVVVPAALAVLGTFCYGIGKDWAATPPVEGANRWCRNGGQKVWCRRCFGVHVTSQRTTKMCSSQYNVVFCGIWILDKSLSRKEKVYLRLFPPVQGRCTPNRTSALSCKAIALALNNHFACNFTELLHVWLEETFLKHLL